MGLFLIHVCLRHKGRKVITWGDWNFVFKVYFSQSCLYVRCYTFYRKSVFYNIQNLCCHYKSLSFIYLHLFLEVLLRKLYCLLMSNLEREVMRHTQNQLIQDEKMIKLWFCCDHDPCQCNDLQWFVSTYVAYLLNLLSNIEWCITIADGSASLGNSFNWPVTFCFAHVFCVCLISLT